jgi:hypothetical protein
MKIERHHIIKLLLLFIGTLNTLICNGQDCPNWGASTMISYNYTALEGPLGSDIKLNGVSFNFSATLMDTFTTQCIYPNDIVKRSNNYSINLVVTNNSNYRVSVRVAYMSIDAEKSPFGGQWTDGGNTLENSGLVYPGESIRSLNIYCHQCGGIAVERWCGRTPGYIEFQGAVTDLKENDFEYWVISADAYWAWAHDKDTEPIEYRLCAKQHYLTALTLKEDQHCRDRIAEIDNFLEQINNSNNASYNQMVDEYNSTNQRINDYINNGNYENAIKELEKLKEIAEKIAPDEVAGIERKIQELKDFLANKSKGNNTGCPEGNVLINECQVALSEYMNIFSQTMNGNGNTSNELLNSSQNISSIFSRISTLGCNLTDAQLARLDELMRMFANAASEIADKGLDNLLKDVNKQENDVSNSNNGPLVPGAYIYNSIPKKEITPTLKGTKGGGATLKGNGYDGKQY